MIYCSFCIQHGEVFVNHIVHSMQKSGSTNLNSLEGTSSFFTSQANIRNDSSVSHTADI